MKRKRQRIFKEGFGLSIIIGLLIVVFLYALSWLVTCGLIKLITMCFGWAFKWPIATGIWLILCIAKTFFGSDKSSK